MGNKDLRRDNQGRFATLYDEAFKAQVRIDYETSGLILSEIANKHSISGSIIQRWAHAGRWQMRQPRRIDPNDLVARMLSLLDEQMADLETVMTNGTTEVAMLSKLVNTLDRVLALKARSAKEDKQPSTRVATLHAKIAERLAELNRD
jgi:hypothetical protein